MHRNVLICFVVSAMFALAAGPTVAAAPKAALRVGPAVASGPISATDESNVPHYFGPYPNWANSPLTLPTATIAIVDGNQGPGTGATATATVNPGTGGIGQR